jgi:cytoskeletal protein CcmA (bactofilin family)
MPETPRRRLLDRMGATPTLVAEHTTIRGDLDCRGPLMVNGQVQGNARVRGELAIAAGATWVGNIEAEGAVIAGKLLGNITVVDKLELSSTAVVDGQITARRIAIARGAQVLGEIQCTGSEPVIEFEERRAAIA